MAKRYAKALSLEELAALQDDQIDTSDIPPLDEAFFRNAQLVMPSERTKTPVTMRVDAEVLEWFKGQGKGHLTRMNAVLRAYVLAQKDKNGKSSSIEPISR